MYVHTYVCMCTHIQRDVARLDKLAGQHGEIKGSQRYKSDVGHTTLADC